MNRLFIWLSLIPAAINGVPLFTGTPHYSGISTTDQSTTSYGVSSLPANKDADKLNLFDENEGNEIKFPTNSEEKEIKIVGPNVRSINDEKSGIHKSSNENERIKDDHSHHHGHKDKKEKNISDEEMERTTTRSPKEKAIRENRNGHQKGSGDLYMTDSNVTPRPPISCERNILCRASRGMDQDDNYQEQRNRNKNEYFKHPDDATYFYTCENGLPSCLPCPTSKLSFSERCQMCLGNEDDECPTTSPVLTRSLSEIEMGCAKDYCQTKENGHFANSEDKKLFYMCSNSITYCMNCPSGLSFDETCVKCVGGGAVGKSCDEY